MKEMKTLTIGDVQYRIVDESVGQLEELSTENKASLVAAINEVASNNGVNVETDPTVPAWAKAATKPSYTASEVGALPNTTKIPGALSDLSEDSTHRVVTDAEKTAWNAKANSSDIPTKVSQLQNDSGYLTSYTETDPTVPAWAKASSKPSYTKSEVGLGNVDNVKQYSASNPPPYPVTKVNGQTGDVTVSVPTKVSQLQNDSGYLTEHQDVSGKADKNALTLGYHTDGLVYLFIDGSPVGSGIELSSGGISGYVDSENNIVINNLPDGSYTVKYEMEDGSTIDIGDLELDTNVYYSVTNTLTSCTNSNSATQVVEGESYSATITPNSGYELESIVVTMGGSPVTVSGGNISIAEVTGNIVITAVATEIPAGPTYTNLADPTSTDWWTDSYLSSSAAQRSKEGFAVTNFIGPLNNGDIIRIKGLDVSGTIAEYRLAPYKADKTLHGSYGTTTLSGAESFVSDKSLSTTESQFTLTKSDIIYFRFGGELNGTANDVIITINEPIS